MARGKQAVMSLSRKTSDLQDQIQSLEARLQAERQARHADQIRHEQEMSAVTREVAGKAAELVQMYLVGQVEHLAAGLLASDWVSRRTAMTQHLAWLFLKGHIDWDRLTGDVEVLTFIATHGDLNTWFYLMDKHGHQHPRGTLRNVSKGRERGFLVFANIENDVSEALKGSDRALKDRVRLNDVVGRARNAFTAVEVSDIVSEGEPVQVEVTHEQRAMHAEIMRWLPLTLPIVTKGVPLR